MSRERKSTNLARYVPISVDPNTLFVQLSRRARPWLKLMRGWMRCFPISSPCGAVHPNKASMTKRKKAPAAPMLTHRSTEGNVEKRNLR